MIIRVLLIFIFVCYVFPLPACADKISMKDKIKSILRINNTNPRPLQVKTVPAGSACSPDAPKNCDVKR